MKWMERQKNETLYLCIFRPLAIIHWPSGWTWDYISLHALQWIKCVRMSLSHRVRKAKQSQKHVNMWICRETSTHGKSLLCQISGCTSIQSLDCPDLITPLLAKGSLTERFLTLKSNPSQIRRWLNLIYVGFMRHTVPRRHCIPLNTRQEPLVCNLEIFNVSIIWKNPTGPVWTRLKGEWRAWNGRTAGKNCKIRDIDLRLSMIFGEIRKRHFELVRLPVNPAPLPQASGPRQVLGIGTIKQQGLHRQAEFNEILNVRKALTCTFAVRWGGEGRL